MSKTSLFIGRFQPFHKGHLSVVEAALKENDFLIIGIGSAENNYLPENPFTAGERWEMITLALDEAKISRDQYTIIPVRNINNYALWVDHVAKIVPPFELVYTGSKIVKTLFEDHGKYPIHDVDMTLDVSATRIRESILNDGDWESHISPAVARYLKTINAVHRLKQIQTF
ncbi:MAG: nicotinamide-nucleotide adenylyltransferase [Candidatus Peregrinibacteria bacterium]|nr:nicotinamide-nucleotide adenylyltransferase [Candidatus Peregrinibacteria bacterium]